MSCKTELSKINLVLSCLVLARQGSSFWNRARSRDYDLLDHSLLARLNFGAFALRDTAQRRLSRRSEDESSL